MPAPRWPTAGTVQVTSTAESAEVAVAGLGASGGPGVLLVVPDPSVAEPKSSAVTVTVYAAPGVRPLMVQPVLVGPGLLQEASVPGPLSSAATVKWSMAAPPMVPLGEPAGQLTTMELLRPYAVTEMVE